MEKEIKLSESIIGLIDSIKQNVKSKEVMSVTDMGVVDITIEHCKELLESGCNCVIAPVMNSQLFSSKKSIKSVRELLVKEKSVFAVIQLSNCLLESTNIALSIIILKKNCDSVRLIDASEISTKEKQNRKILSDSDIQIITDKLLSDSDICTTVDPDIIAQHGFNLFPSEYLNSNENGICLERAALSVITGLSITGKSDVTVKKKVISISDVKPFTTINIDELEIKEVSEKVFERYYLSGKYLLISKNGAITVNIANNENVIVSNGVTAVKLVNDEMCEYFEAFLNSDNGLKQLSSSGSVIPKISVKSIYVPNADTATMKSVRAAYAAMKDSIITLDSCRAKLVSSINCLF